MPEISIIIVFFKVKRELFECLDSIYQSRPKTNFEIIVVDNDDKKTIGAELKKRFPKVKYIESKVNIGYGAGNNLGVKHARSENLFILNPDTKIYSGDLSKLVDYIDKHKRIGIVAPLLVDKNNQPFPFQGSKELTPKYGIFSLSFISKLFPNNRIFKEYWFLGWDKAKNQKVDVVPGTAFMIKKELFDRLGGFDEKFFLFFEEFDLCKRIKNFYRC